MAANPSIQLGTDGNWAIKEDNLLAYKKDGTRFFNKEFDFTRGSLATFVDKDGLIKYSGVTDTELVINGDFATDSYWSTPLGWEIIDGKLKGTNVNAVSATQGGYTFLNKSFKVVYTISDYVQGDVRIYLGGTQSTPNRSADGTYTEYISITTANTTLYIQGINNFTGSITNISVKEIQTDVPRIDFTDDATGHLLLEPQSTNLITYSEDFSQWTKYNSSVNTNSIQSPSGFLDADKIIENTSNSTHFVAPIVNNVPSSGVATLSVFAKKGENNWIKLVQYTNYANFDLGNGVIGNSSAISTNIIDYGNGWYKCIMNFNVAGSGANLDFKLGENNTSNWDDIYTGDGTSGVYLWGAQLEALSYATSYIPTLVSTATRNAEVCNNSGSAQDFNDNEGVLYMEVNALANDGTIRYFGLSDGSSSNRALFLFDSTENRVRAIVSSGGTKYVDFNYDVTDITEFHKIALKYKENDFSLYVDGAERNTDTSGLTPIGLDRFEFQLSGSGNFYGKTKNLKVFKRAMSDGELYLLTVPQYQSYQEMATALNYTL